MTIRDCRADRGAYIDTSESFVSDSDARGVPAIRRQTTNKWRSLKIISREFPIGSWANFFSPLLFLLVLITDPRGSESQFLYRIAERGHTVLPKETCSTPLDF